MEIIQWDQIAQENSWCNFFDAQLYHELGKKVLLLMKIITSKELMMKKSDALVGRV
jgi:hypothetical protein